MKGYWNMPEATAKAIDPDGWFSTGDIGTVDDDGYYSIVDRKKEMILRGGYNVYPREIEEVLYEHPSIKEAAVIGIPHDDLGEEICAVVSLKDGESATTTRSVRSSRSRSRPTSTRGTSRSSTTCRRARPERSSSAASTCQGSAERSAQADRRRSRPGRRPSLSAGPLRRNASPSSKSRRSPQAVTEARVLPGSSFFLPIRSAEIDLPGARLQVLADQLRRPSSSAGTSSSTSFFLLALRHSPLTLRPLVFLSIRTVTRALASQPEADLRALLRLLALLLRDPGRNLRGRSCH